MDPILKMGYMEDVALLENLFRKKLKTSSGARFENNLNDNMRKTPKKEDSSTQGSLQMKNSGDVDMETLEKAFSQPNQNTKSQIQESLKINTKSESNFEFPFSKEKRKSKFISRSSKAEPDKLFKSIFERKFKLRDIDSDISDSDSFQLQEITKKIKKPAARQNDMGTKFKYPIPIEHGYHYQAAIPEYTPNYRLQNCCENSGNWKQSIIAQRIAENSQIVIKSEKL